MNAISVITDIDANPPLPHVTVENIIRVGEGIKFTRIPGGMESGRSAVAVTAALPGGKAVFLELSMANFLNAAAIFKAVEEQRGN